MPDPLKRSLLTLAFVFLALLLPASASATNFEVDTLDDEVNFEGCVNPSTECSLRDAIERANEASGADEITFGEIFHGTIALNESLPVITQPVTIDATTAADYSDVQRPVILLDGSAIETAEPRGLEIAEDAGGSRIEGLAVGGFHLGIFVYGESTTYVCGNYVGVEPDGLTALPNEYAGITTGASGQPGKGTRVGFECPQGNLISGNGEFGILEAGEGTKIARNRIGVNALGAALPNGEALLVSAGIEVNAAAKGVTIGGSEPGEGNVIAHNGGQGIRVRNVASAVEMRGNFIFDNLLAGIQIDAGTPPPVPVLQFVEGNEGGSAAFGKLNGAPDEQYVVEFFANKACDGGGSGEGELPLGEKTIETDSGGLALISATGLASLPNGSEYFTATATAVETGVTSTFSACYDEPPETEISGSPTDPSTSTEAEFQFFGTDPNGSVKDFLCQLDGAGFVECDSPKTYVGLAEGTHTFEVVAFDQVGGPDLTPATYTWFVDTEAPQTQLDSAPSNPSSAASPSFTFSGTDGGFVSAYQCKLDGTPLGSCSSPYPVGPLKDGAHTFEVWAIDNVGREDPSPATHTWTVDTTAPTVQIDSKPASPSTSSQASFGFSGADLGGSGVAGFECKLDGGSFAACSSPQAYDSLAAGAHGFQVRSVDKAGNRSSVAGHDWVVEGLAPPVQTLAAPVNGESVAVAPQSGVVKVKRPGSSKETILKEGQTIPVGSLVDATNGKVTLTSVNAAGETQTAAFYGGKFLVAQHEGSGLVLLKLRGGDFATCKGGARQSWAQASARSGRRLWGSGKGKFRTEGNYGSATVRGTVWLTEDRCDGTFFKVKRGVVSVRDFVAGKTLSLGAGKSYLASKSG